MGDRKGSSGGWRRDRRCGARDGGLERVLHALEELFLVVELGVVLLELPGSGEEGVPARDLVHLLGVGEALEDGATRAFGQVDLQTARRHERGPHRRVSALVALGLLVLVEELLERPTDLVAVHESFLPPPGRYSVRIPAC
jgi:hypothetical protein